MPDPREKARFDYLGPLTTEELNRTIKKIHLSPTKLCDYLLNCNNPAEWMVEGVTGQKTTVCDPCKRVWMEEAGSTIKARVI